eukprot:3842282-Prymnesium_polylepis.1
MKGPESSNACIPEVGSVSAPAPTDRCTHPTLLGMHSQSLCGQRSQPERNHECPSGLYKACVIGSSRCRPLARCQRLRCQTGLKPPQPASTFEPETASETSFTSGFHYVARGA